MKRLLHSITGHSFKILSAGYAGPVKEDFWSSEMLSIVLPKKAALARTGFTAILIACDCGDIKTIEIAGKHEIHQNAIDDPELTELRKIIKQ